MFIESDQRFFFDLNGCRIRCLSPYSKSPTQMYKSRLLQVRALATVWMRLTFASALNDIDSKSAFAGFLVFTRHIQPGLAHRLYNLVKLDLV